MNLNDLYSDIIKENCVAKHNKRHIVNASVVMPGNNPSCGDEIELELLMDEDVIKDASFTGVGCAISQASVTLMIDIVRGKTLEDAKEISEAFLSMTRREPITQEQVERLEDAIALENISNMPSRVKCATMPWHTLVMAIDSYQNKQ